MTKAIKRLLFEAYRRNDMCDSHEKSKPMVSRWLGLGTAAAYRPVLDAGLMTFHDGKIPPPRCMGWLVLTPSGIEAMKELESEFATVLGKLKSDDSYNRSYISQYQLAGGFVSG